MALEEFVGLAQRFTRWAKFCRASGADLKRKRAPMLARTQWKQPSD